MKKNNSELTPQRTNISNRERDKRRALIKTNMKEANLLFIQIISMVSNSKLVTKEMELIKSFASFFLNSEDNLNCLRILELKLKYKKQSDN